jgi:RecB family exonuclease
VFAAGDGRPFHVEWRFGARDARQVSLEVAEGIVVRFAGRLDRVDLVAGGARIVDYKTGSGRTEKERLKDGLSIQLPVYRLALRQTGGEDYEAVRCAYRLVTRRGGFVELALDDDEEVAEARLRHLVARTVALVDAGVFARSTGGRCEYCDVRYACGLTAWARTRKRGHGALSALVALQHGDLGEEGDDAGA